MPEHSLSDIHQQSNDFRKQLSLWRYMESRELTAFIAEIEAFIIKTREFEQHTESQTTKSHLQEIIELWEDILDFLVNRPIPALTVVSTSRKTSPVPGEFSGEEPSMLPIAEKWVGVARSVPQPLNPRKVDRNSPPPIPRDPKLRAIYDKYYGIIDSNGDNE